MSKAQSQVTTLVLPVSGKESSEGSTLIKKYLYHWPLFVIGVSIALAVGYYYLKTAAPSYPITATLEFKTSTSASPGAGNPSKDANALTQLDPVSTPVIVENEVEVIQSNKLISQVVKKLQLWITYSEKKGLKTKDLYNVSPIQLKFIDTNFIINPNGEKLEITLLNNRSFILKDSGGIKKQYQFSSIINSSFGKWQLLPTSNIGSYIGSKIMITIQDPDLVTESYQKNIKAALENKDAPFLHLTMTDEVPARGRDILNSLIEMYSLHSEEVKNNQTQRALDFVGIRLDSLRKELNEEDRTIEDYKSKNKITDIALEAGGNRNNKDANLHAINEINVQLSTLQTLEKYANSSLNSEKIPSGSENLPDKTLAPLIDKISSLQLERQQKLAITPATNPMFIALDNQIKSLKTDFRDKIEAMKTTLLANKQQLVTFGSGIQTSLNKVPVQEKQYNYLIRDKASKEQLYQFLSSKREELSLRYATLLQSFEIVDDAHAGSKKWPKAPIILAVAFILGLAIAPGILYIRESIKEQVTSRKQIEEGTEVPIIGELSYQYTKSPIVITEGRSKFAIGEQFRVLRTNLFHLHGNNDPGRVTLFTSSVSGEGKSFVSGNLAVILAYASRKTIILEMDLRKPKVSVMFGLPTDQPGISDYLANEDITLESIIHASGIPGLDVLSCGSILPNPSELLEKQRLDELINSLRKLYDDVIIDSPPIHLVTDSLIISRVADATLYVIRQDYTLKHEMEFIKEINESNRFNKFNLVLNGVKKNASTYGGGYYQNSYYNNPYAAKEKKSFGTFVKTFANRF